MAINWNGFGLPKPYYQDEWVTQHCGDALVMLPTLPDNSIDLLCTDPPYGIGFMGKDWDKALPDKKIWAECLRVLKPGAFAFVMSIPRSDCLSRMIISLEDVGFRVDFTPIYWTYASGFPKAQNIGKAVDKRLGSEREVIGQAHGVKSPGYEAKDRGDIKVAGQFQPIYDITNPSTPQAKALDGSYGGFQPKPAVEVIIVCMKPLSEKTFVDQALKNQKGITWLDDCRIPISAGDRHEYGVNGDEQSHTGETGVYGDFKRVGYEQNNQGRFPANLIVSDDVLNDGRITKSTGGSGEASMGALGDSVYGEYNKAHGSHAEDLGDSGSFSRYFDLDKWAQKTFPFLIVPKASKSEKNKGLDGSREFPKEFIQTGIDGRGREYTTKPRTNTHPTVKPLKLMSYLITLGSRPSDTVIDPFGGSGTTALASKLLGRYCIISEIEEKYCEIAAKRYSQSVMRLEI